MERLFNTLILLILSIYCHSQIEISTPKIIPTSPNAASLCTVSYKHLRDHETRRHLV